ncbi:MAG: site-2 protease family protein [Brevinematia bacterium]
MDFVFSAIAICILVISVVFHEYAHGKVSYIFGDPTPKNEGRLTFNPLKHLDPVGSVLLPLFLVLLNTGFVIGWAKPVPINPDNYKNKRLGWILTSLAGPLANYSVAVVSLLVLLVINSLFHPATLLIVDVILWYFIAINFILGSFNLIPLPPLDGFWVILNLFPEGVRTRVMTNLSSRFYPLIIVITAIVAVFISRYTILPLLKQIGVYLKIFS